MSYPTNAMYERMARAAIAAERRDPSYDDDLQLGATERMVDRLLADEAFDKPAVELSDLAYDAVCDELWRQKSYEIRREMEGTA